VTDLLRLKHLAFVDSFEEDGKLIVQAKSRRHSEPAQRLAAVGAKPVLGEHHLELQADGDALALGAVGHGPPPNRSGVASHRGVRSRSGSSAKPVQTG
jgi:hypothetical protein